MEQDRPHGLISHEATDPTRWIKEAMRVST
jgi:hypothetical protein